VPFLGLWSDLTLPNKFACCSTKSLHGQVAASRLHRLRHLNVHGDSSYGPCSQRRSTPCPTRGGVFLLEYVALPKISGPERFN
jgi:hypothetical protein